MTRFMPAAALLAATSFASAPAWAGDKPLYAPAPSWVVPAPALEPAKIDASAPVVLVLDTQQRLEKGLVWSYVDTATRIATPELLSRLGTVAIPWMPDKGDLIVHSAELLRGTERIDLLAGGGEKFAVLRREKQLERRTLDGQLTATLAVEGLRVGDILRVRLSITNSDAALKGELQTIAPMFPEPFNARFARTRLSWPSTTPIKWRTYAEGLSVAPKAEGGFSTIEIALPVAKQPDLPGDLPGRFMRPPIIEATSFADWAAVSRTMAPLYASEGTIPAGSPLAAEVAKIRAASADPLHRAAAALRLAQDQVGYLALGMNGGNYVPQTPVNTWELRYGDCKAKTLLLLAMLRELGIAAEPVLVSSENGDLVTARLPMPGAFDHVIVRADVAGQSYWLDGTGNGARLADIGDTPAFRTGLPLRVAGAELMPLPARANARPDVTVDTVFDHSAGVDLPSTFTTEIRMRGASAALINAALAQATAKQRLEIAASGVQEYVGGAQIAASSLTYDPESATATVSASGVLTTRWRREQKRMRLGLDTVVGLIGFNPDRSRPAWKNVPVSTGNPEGREYRTTMILPDGGRGFTFEGDPALSATIAGADVSRKASLAAERLRIEERIANSGAEIAPEAIAAERSKLAVAKARELRVLAPGDLAPRWRTVLAGGKARYAPLEAAYGKAIALIAANDPTEDTGYESRLSFRRGIWDYRGAIEDATKLLTMGETAERLLQRAALHAELNDRAKALADARAALALDPGSDTAIFTVARLEGRTGDVKGALARVQTRIDQGGKDVADAIPAKADLLAQSGDGAGAVAALDEALAERPGSPGLLNERCWIKGTRKIALESALKDCTKAIELSDGPAAALDSRAMVYWRMNRIEEALADLDAALEIAPNLAGSLFLRGVIRKRTGKTAEGETDLKGARLISPAIDAEYADFGVTA